MHLLCVCMCACVCACDSFDEKNKIQGLIYDMGELETLTHSKIRSFVNQLMNQNSLRCLLCHDVSSSRTDHVHVLMLSPVSFIIQMSDRHLASRMPRRLKRTSFRQQRFQLSSHQYRKRQLVFINTFPLMKFTYHYPIVPVAYIENGTLYGTVVAQCVREKNRFCGS